MGLAEIDEWGPWATFWKCFLKALSSRCAVRVSSDTAPREKSG